jgi:hypothetical protein
MPALAPSPLTESGTHLRQFLRAFVRDERWVVELRALHCPQGRGRPVTEFGFFDLSGDEGQRAFGNAVKAILGRAADQQPTGVYVTINPLVPELLARSFNRLRVAYEKHSASDANVLRRRWLLIDVDPVRIAGISATDTEKEAARRVLDGVREDLDGRGWPRPLVLDSGNGFHLWYPIDLPTEDGGVVERVVKGLARLHNTQAATLDTSVFNPSRIAKLPGTWARKGDATADRPHRMARVLEVPT